MVDKGEQMEWERKRAEMRSDKKINNAYVISGDLIIWDIGHIHR